MTAATPSPAGDVESATALLSVLQDDVHHVHVRVTAALGIAAVFVTQIPLEEHRAQPDWTRATTIFGIVLLALAAAFYFQYTQQLNKLRLRIAAECLAPRAGASARSWKQQFETKRPSDAASAPPEAWPHANVWLYRIGQGLFALGALFVSITLVRLFLY